MKKVLSRISLIVAAGVVLTSCAISAPLMVTSNSVGSKTGEASYKVVFGIAPLNADAGAIKAAKNGKITKIATVDQTVKGGLFSQTVTTVVTGE